MYLGEIYSEHFDKTTQTTVLLDNFYKCHSKKNYNTLQLKDVFVMWKPKPNGTLYEEVSAGVSFYVKDTCNDSSNAIKCDCTFTHLKNKYCDNIRFANLESKDMILYTVSRAFVNDLFDKNGDYLFDKPIRFRAQNTYYRNSGYGRTSNFYIIGVNFNGVKFQKHLKEIENQDNKKLDKNLAANQMKQMGFPTKDIKDFVEHNIVYLYNQKKVFINEKTEPELSSYLQKVNGCVYAVVPEQNNDLFLVLYAHENNDNLIKKVFVKNTGYVHLVEAKGWGRDGRNEGTIAGIMTNSTSVESVTYKQARELFIGIVR